MKSNLIVKYPEKLLEKYRDLKTVLAENKKQIDEIKLDKAFQLYIDSLSEPTDSADKHSIFSALDVAEITVKEIGLGVTSVISIFLYKSSLVKILRETDITREYGSSVSVIFGGLEKISYFGTTSQSANAENLRKLLLNLAKDVRVILICIAEQLQLMRLMKNIRHEQQYCLACDAFYLYAPLAHRLGLYVIKSEMEDLSLKYTDRRTYDLIARKLAETMRARNKFIEEFILPINNVLKENRFDYEIKGRPKSIHSIWNKMKKKGVEFEDIYDLFAIRIVLNSDTKNEKSDCWKVYSLVTEIYQPNPLRLRDWISVPKTNGYESLHTTVIGPGGRWVEVQIRSVRMNEIAEKGFAAHWKYKGLEGEEKGLDEWLFKVREMLETPHTDAEEFIDDFKLSLYSKEIFVFTPKGELRKFPKNATILDFAYDIHSDMGSMCVGAKINGKNVPIKYVMQNGDRVEIQTSKNQTPKLDWLNIVTTSKAKSKIRQKLNEEKFKEAETGKEIIKRRFKNWKIPYNDEIIRSLLKKYKLKNAQEFYYLVSTEKIELSEIKEFLTEKENRREELLLPDDKPVEQDLIHEIDDDFLLIDEKVSNVDYKLSKCCNPIFGDDIFGFVTINEGIKIHRTNCPNAAQLLSKYGYRVVKARWNKSDRITSFPADILISGEDVPGILNSISDVISKELNVALRSISLDSENGVFQGKLKLMVLDLKHLDALMARLSKIKGIYSVKRQEGSVRG